MHDVTFGVLGPVEVQAPGRPAVALPPAVRALLARLVLAPGRVLSVDQLTDALWGEDLPADATNALQIRVSKLRRALAAAGIGGDVLVTRAPGYQMSISADRVDAHRFERLLGEARNAADPAAYDAALALWRGPALADVGDAEWARAESTRLEELRLGATEDRFDLLLQAGRHGEVVADLEGLVAEHPLRERMHRLLMLALYRAGRQADALTCYHALRGQLAEELGIDPSPDLQALAEAILRQQVPGSSPSPPKAPREDDPLPRRLTSIIGRQDDLATVLDQLAQARVVTLTGPGGVGKTTLSLEAARRADARVHFVRLAALGTGADVTQEFASQLGLTAGSAEVSADTIAAYLTTDDTLLVVDNCEHVIDSAAALVEYLVQACLRLRVLATSREALAVHGEVQVAVSPLAVPDETADTRTIADTSAVRLFIDRARAVRPSFALDAETAPVVAAICRELDGMPLAIELAAARVKALPPAEIADRLRDRFALLTGGPRTSDARHRTLRAVLDWSHDLLPEQEQRLLRRLAVFRGGWTLEAAEAVCGFAGITPGEVPDLLFRLLDRSLVVPDPATGRFRLLVTVRQYAAARLKDADETGTVRQRHLDHYTHFAEEHSPAVRFGAVAWARLTEDHDNLRAAIEHALAHSPEAALRLANALIWFWSYALRYEGIRALTTALDTGQGTTAARAKALQGIGWLDVYYPGPRSIAAAQESLTIFEELNDVENAALSRLILAWFGQYQGDATEQRAMIVQSRDELGDADRGWFRAMTHYAEALLDLRLSRFEESATRWRQALEQLTAIGDRAMASAVVAHLGIALREAGQHPEALTVLGKAVTEARAQESPHALAFSLVHLSHTRLDLDDEDAVPDLLSEADEVARRARNPRCQAWAAWGRARLATKQGQTATAANECRTALTLLEEREFPWARARLWTLMADTTQDPTEAEQARTKAATLSAEAD